MSSHGVARRQLRRCPSAPQMSWPVRSASIDVLSMGTLPGIASVAPSSSHPTKRESARRRASACPGHCWTTRDMARSGWADQEDVRGGSCRVRSAREGADRPAGASVACVRSQRKSRL